MSYHLILFDLDDTLIDFTYSERMGLKKLYEDYYRDLRKKKHSAFSEVLSFIEAVETDQICNITYDNDTESRDICYSAYNGILKKGLSSTV